MSLYSPGKFAVTCIAAVALSPSLMSAADNWRSALYPEDWKPGYEAPDGGYLHDFSYAGYQRGEQPIPDRKDNVIDVTSAPYLADKTGQTDATAAIQAAIDAAGDAGGGVVFLPAGTYKVAPSAEGKNALLISGDSVVLRGEGKDKTFLFNDSVQMRNKSVITIGAKNGLWWGSKGYPTVPITQDLLKPTTVIPVADLADMAVGDYVVIRSDMTQRMIDQLGMTGVWKPTDSYLPAPTYARRITAIDPSARTITVDVPLRGFIYAADNARVAILKKAKPVQESGVEYLSIGMKQHPGGGLDDDDKKNMTEGTTAYEIFRAAALIFDGAENCWARGISSYCPPGNNANIHLLSHGVRLMRTRNVTVEDCFFAYPQYRGEGGNGYMYTLYGNECLLKNCTGKGGRHNFSFGEMGSTGNVLLNFHAIDGRLPSDFHMYLSRVNLIDNAVADGDYFAAVKRFAPPTHGETTSESVFWNTKGLRYQPEVGEYAGHATKNPQFLIISHQWGQGYVIGTQGPCHDVETDDFCEGVGRGEALLPQSLYEDQLRRRLATTKPQ
ncbi:pectate lyase superfamily protein [Terrimicrobium sacchariphilum]|uniref:Pectate lyase superfamily protein n=1 Tax=Terrimicrobium sacchariphilum TaxID=690879 RepID=A0A146G4Z5_TERSA|nr:glycosyl hydrolase family 28-related protein [Terrimicrobium sacchariphilum]GAT32869.1 pectate lyase superfamily protein [Terrimicrobium sacchariphilum]